MQEPTLRFSGEGRSGWNGTSEMEFHRSCRGSGDGMYAKGTRRHQDPNTEKPAWPDAVQELVCCGEEAYPNAQPKLNRSSQIPPDFFYDAPCVSKSWHKRETTRRPGRMSSMPHSSASHQSSAVLEEVASTIGTQISIPLIRSTRSLQLPSARASSVTITVFSRAELRKSTAALMVRAHCTTSPRASMSCAMGASGLLLDTKITVPARLSVCIDSQTLPDSTLSPPAIAWP